MVHCWYIWKATFPNFATIIRPSVNVTRMEENRRDFFFFVLFFPAFCEGAPHFASFLPYWQPFQHLAHAVLRPGYVYRLAEIIALTLTGLPYFCLVTAVV